jgi:hypothetical protein
MTGMYGLARVAEEWELQASAVRMYQGPAKSRVKQWPWSAVF